MTQGMPAASTPTRPTADRPGLPAGVLWTFRVATALELASLLTQALTAGGLLGDAATGAVHGSGSTFVHVFGLAVLVAGILVWRPGRGPLWPAVVGLVVLLAGVVQSALGGSGNIVAHVPTGVTLTVLTTWLTAWAWMPRRAS